MKNKKTKGNLTNNQTAPVLQRSHTMYGEASQLRTFVLMPLEPQFRKPIEAAWEFKVVDMRRRLIAFNDLSEGEVTSWHWNFGDGKTSDEQHPLHAYERTGRFVVTLDIEGPAGKSRCVKVWDVAVK